MIPIDRYTDEELAAMAQVDIASIIAGETPATASTPLMAIDAETELPIVVSAFDLAMSMLRNAEDLGPGTPACGAATQRALGLLDAIGCGIVGNCGSTRRRRRQRAVA